MSGLWRILFLGGLALVVVGLLAACASGPTTSSDGSRADTGSSSRGGGYYQNDGPPDDQDVDIHSIPDAVPTREPYSKYGNPSSYEALGKTYYVLRSAEGFTQTGRASWYGRQFHGKRTSSGDPYNMYKMTAAHKRLPIPSYVRVTNLDNGKHVVVRVNDRGPFHDGRIIDLSYVAARKLGIVAAGSAPVRIKTVTPDSFAAEDTTRQTRQTHPSASKSQPATVTTRAEPRAPRTVRVANSGNQARHGNLYLQAGAFGELAHARSLSARLRASGFERVVMVEPDRATPYYRVRIGPFDNQSRREAAHNNLVANGFAAREVKR